MMTTDYKSRANRKKSTPKKKVSVWIIFMLGFLSGGFVSSLIFLNTPKPKPALLAMGTSTTNQPPKEIPVTDPDQPPKPEFKFYSMLPEMEVPAATDVTTSAINTKKWTPPMVIDKKTAPVTPIVPVVTSIPKPTPINKPKTTQPQYLLQLGSFRQTRDAERVKARVALIGVESAVQRFVGKNHQVYYRVRTTFPQDKTILTRLRQRLSRQGIDSFLIRVVK